MAEQEIYEHFINWLKQSWWGLPEADELMPLAMATCTPEEASLLTGMPFSTRSLEELAEMKQMDPAELGRWLDALANKGLVYRSVRGETVRYRLNDSFFVYYRSLFWPGRADARSKATAPLVNQYYYHGFFDQYDLTHLKGLRVLPIQEVIVDTRQILPYEEVVKVLDSLDYFTVSTCPAGTGRTLTLTPPIVSIPLRLVSISVRSATT